MLLIRFCPHGAREANGTRSANTSPGAFQKLPSPGFVNEVLTIGRWAKVNGYSSRF
jgi:hypothetical protein